MANTMSPANPDIQSSEILQTTQSPAPPLYLATPDLGPEGILNQALEDVAQHKLPAESRFHVSPDRRQNPAPNVLQKQLVDLWENLPRYQPLMRDLYTNANHPESLIEAFFLTVIQGNSVLVARVLDSGLLDANTPRTDQVQGLTPLLCAIQSKHLDVIKVLLSHGADVNQFGICRAVSIENAQMRDARKTKHWAFESAVRTPLQLAAQLGDLELVKLLREEYHADDSIVAPDGQIALRLAKSNKHEAIVSYLPARRGGGYRRWKTKHHKLMKGMRKSVDIFKDIGLFFCWRLPKWTVEYFVDVVKEVFTYVKENIRHFPAWCMRRLKELWKLILNTPRYVRKTCAFIWRCIVHLITKTIPRATKALWNFLKAAAVATANGVKWIANRLASFLHTLYHAIISAFKALTWANVKAGFVELVRAIFISFPRALWKAAKKTVPATVAFFKFLFKGAKSLVRCAWEMVKFLLGHIWKILSSIGGSTGAAGKEVYVFFNPKG